MKTNKENIFAAGDIVTFPLFIADDQQANVQHWQMAHTHGNNSLPEGVSYICSYKYSSLVHTTNFLSLNHVDKK